MSLNYKNALSKHIKSAHFIPIINPHTAISCVWTKIKWNWWKKCNLMCFLPLIWWGEKKWGWGCGKDRNYVWLSQHYHSTLWKCLGFSFFRRHSRVANLPSPRKWFWWNADVNINTKFSILRPPLPPLPRSHSANEGTHCWLSSKPLKSCE